MSKANKGLITSKPWAYSRPVCDFKRVFVQNAGFQMGLPLTTRSEAI